MTTQLSMPTEAIECPPCLGEGKLKRTEVLDRLGVKAPRARRCSPHPTRNVAAICGMWVRPEVPVICFFASASELETSA